MRERVLMMHMGVGSLIGSQAVIARLRLDSQRQMSDYPTGNGLWLGLQNVIATEGLYILLDWQFHRIFAFNHK